LKEGLYPGDTMRIAIIVGFTLILSGCPNTYQVNPKVSPTSDSQPLTRPVSINHPGPLLHEASGLRFAERYDDFQRTAAMRYDTAGLDASFNYNTRWTNCKLVATFYVYSAPRRMTLVGAPPNMVSSTAQEWLQKEFDRTKAAMKHIHRSMQSMVVDSVTTPARGDDLNGHSMTFRKSGNISELRLFVYQAKWFLKYRFTYPEWCQTDAYSKIEALTRQLPWTTPE
jgi:hypothetical protein